MGGGEREGERCQGHLWGRMLDSAREAIRNVDRGDRIYLFIFFLFLLVPPHRTRHRLGILMVRNWSSALQRFNYVTLVSRSPLNSSLYVSGATERQANLRFFLPTYFQSAFVSLSEFYSSLDGVTDNRSYRKRITSNFLNGPRNPPIHHF